MVNLVKSKKKVLLILVYFIAIIISIYIEYYLEYGSITQSEMNIMKSYDPEMGLDFFYHLQDSGLVLSIFLIMIGIIPNIISIDFLIFKNNHFNYMLMTRLKYKKLDKAYKLWNIIVTFILVMITYMVILVVIHLFYFKISFTINPEYADATRQTALFSDSLLLSLIIYILLSSLGYSLYSYFLYSLQVFVNNIYLYRTLGICVTLVLYIGSAILSYYILNITNNYFLSTVSYFLNITNIITPGIITSSILDNHYILYYLGSFILYYFISDILFYFKEKKEYVDG